MDPDQDFIPVNDLEAALVESHGGRMPADAFRDIFLRSPIYVPSAAAIQSDWSGYIPVVFDRDGVEILVCFTSADRAQRVVMRAPYVLQVQAGDFISRLLPNLGVVLNPGFPLTMELLPAAVKRMADYLRSTEGRGAANPPT